ncbi:MULTISPECIES: hypothetical protein [unclassified Bradyrhizobium]|uniref:hypothetical protein n=1 Tax=unclassified Bradyrhizobium TaxID=2631580 RepID=UPI0029160B08|nr:MULTISPECIES: hypothetical protein [unclassified Bradyrhizobium]
MPRFAIVDTTAKTVINVVEYDDAPSNPPPGFEKGIIAVPSDEAGPDWGWDGSALVAPAIREPPVIVPASASKLGLRRVFVEQGRWDQVKAMIAVNPDTQEEWDLAIEIKRTDPLAERLIAAMKLEPADVDAILVRAKQLTD